MKTNNIIHTISVNNKQVNCIVEIRLNDECKNGHQDFAITATFWKINRVRNDRDMIYGGCCHDEIEKYFPELKPFINLHLSDCLGRPMYATENGRYFLKEKGVKSCAEYLRITEQQAESLLPFKDDKMAFAYYMEKLGVLGAWEEEAKKAIKILEGLTGKEFENTSTRYQYTPLTPAEKTELEAKENKGLLSAESMQAQKAERLKLENLVQAEDELKEVRTKLMLLELKKEIISFCVATNIPLKAFTIVVQKDCLWLCVQNYCWNEHNVTQQQLTDIKFKFVADYGMGRLYIKEDKAVTA